MKRDPIERGLVGPAGEHFVLFRLYRRGMLASLAPPGLSTVDILVLSFTQDIVATVQVKTRTSGRDRGWHMRSKHEDRKYVSERHFYAFVDLEDEPPTVYIVPSAVVADVLRKSHEAWGAKPGKKGQRRNVDNPMRRIQPAYPDAPADYPPGWLDKYRENWELLEQVAGSQPSVAGA